MFEDKNLEPQSAGQPKQPTIPEPTVMPASVTPPATPVPKDMFADVDQPASAQGSGAAGPASASIQPSAMTSQTAQGSGAGYTFEEDEEPKAWYMQKKFIILLLGIALLLIIVIFGVQFALRLFVNPLVPIVPAEQPAKAAPLAPEPTTQQESAPSQEQQQGATGSAEQQQPITPAQVDVNQQQNGQQLDTDGDGLLDAEEQAIGSSITLPDTDGDGLTDREEFRVFGTDPKNPDSDGDTYIDGVEVKNGYNPKGEGKLFTVPQE